MPDLSFSDFLGKMSGETNRPKKRHLREEESKQKPEKPINKEKPKPEPKPEKRETQMPKTTKNDDIIIKAMDYSTRFMKVIYDNFDNEKDRNIVLKSIRSAIDLALGGESPQVYQEPIKPKQQPQSQETNENIDIKMNDLSGQEISIKPQPPMQMEEDGIYKQNLNLGLKVGNDGKQEVDLSRVSQKDIYEMRVLAGVDPEQKARETKNQPLNEGAVNDIERGDGEY